jgi:glycosyltransferase involved in cell wall biosynthesis
VNPPGKIEALEGSTGRWSVGVVVPACNEEATVEACIASILASLDNCPAVESSMLVVVADSCTDKTAERAIASLGQRGVVIECGAASAGAARRTGVKRVLEQFSARAASRLWIANTDADSRPDIDWISRQLALADQQYCAVAGIVRMDAIDGCRSDIARRLLDDYTVYPDGTHPHVHGANLGIRADTYLDAGGWSQAVLAEDHCLWGRIRARGWRVASSIASVVATSGRLRGRAPGGFADTLRAKLERLSA